MRFLALMALAAALLPACSDDDAAGVDAGSDLGADAGVEGDS
jgi:hypothetical protein